jgi:hypothetical protein
LSTPTCRIKKSAKALSPVISILLMIVIAVAASLVAYLWVNNYIGFTTSKAGEAIQIQSMARDPLSGNLVIYLQNVGQGTVSLNPISGVYINGRPEPSDITPTTLSVGQTSTITTTYQITTDAPITVKIVTNEGVFTQSSTNTGFFALPVTQPTLDQCKIIFAKGTGGSASSPADNHWYNAGARIPIFAFADSGYTFSRWAANTSLIVFDESTSASTWATINANGTITAAFTQTRYIVTFSLGIGGATLNPSGTQTYTLGAKVPITTSALNGYSFVAWTTTGQVSVDKANSASTTAIINGAGTATASFTLIQFLVDFTANNGGTSTTNPFGSHTYNPGQQVTIAANPAAGYTFSAWTTTGSIVIDHPNSATTTATINSPGQISANFNTQTKITPTLTCAANPGSVKLGQTITNSGTLSASGGLSGKTVIISYSLQGETPITHTQTTDNAGTYTDSSIPNGVGKWFIQATFAGDSDYNPANSATQTVIVNPPDPVTIHFLTNGMAPDTESANILTVDSDNYTYGQIQTLQFNWVPGTTHTVVASTPISSLSENKQYAWMNWEATSFGTKTTSTYTYTVPNTAEIITVNFVPQTQILFAYLDQYGTYVEADPTITYITAGIEATVQATKYGSETVWADVDSIYTYPTNLPTTQTNMQWQTPDPTGIVQQSNDWIQPFYYGQYRVALSYVIMGGGNPKPPTFTTYQNGLPTDITLTKSPIEYWLDDFDYAVTPSIQDNLGNPDEIWQLAQPEYGSISQLHPAATFTYYHQYTLAVTTNPKDIEVNFQVTCTQFGIQYNSQSQTTTWSEWVDASVTTPSTATISNIQNKVGTLIFQNAAPSQTVTMNQPQQIILNYR